MRLHLQGNRVLNITTRSVAVTGAGSGLGRDIALGLAAKGYRVFGTAMRPFGIRQVAGGMLI